MSVMSETIDSVRDPAPTPDEIRAALDRMIVQRRVQPFAAARRVPALRGRGGAARQGRPHQGLHHRRRGAAPRSPSSIRRSIRSCASRRRGCGARWSAITPGPGLDDPIVDRSAARLLRADLPPARDRAAPCASRPAARSCRGRARLRAGAARSRRRRRSRSSSIAAVASALLYRPVGRHHGLDRARSARDGEDAAQCRALPAGNGMPVVRIEPMRVIGTPSSRSGRRRTAARQDQRCVRALRHDQRGVRPRCWRAPACAGRRAAHADYRLSGALEYTGNVANAWFTLTSVAEGKVVWSRTFERIAVAGRRRPDRRLRSSSR